MKKIIIILIVIIIIICGAFMIKNRTDQSLFKVDLSTNMNKVKIGEEIVLQIKSNEQVVATNFEIICDINSFELIGSETENFRVAEKDGKIACIYADISGKGTDSFKLKLKAKQETNSKFSIENSKFRVVGQDESYVQENIQGINKKINIKVSK